MSASESFHIQTVDGAIARLAGQRYGVFSRDEAIARGATAGAINRRIATGRWHRLHRGVFRLAGAPPTWHQSLYAACLAWGPDAFASHRAAAALRSLAGFEGQHIELIVPRGRSRHDPDVILHRMTLRPGDTTTLDHIPVTTTARTLVDLAGLAPKDAVEEALDDALRRRLTTIQALRRQVAVGESAPTRGVKVIRALLKDRSPSATPSDSVLGTKLWRVLVRGGIKHGIRQYRVWRDKTLVGIVDVAFPDEGVAVEADGYRWHSGQPRWKRDLARRNELVALGWRVLHFTWSDVVETPDRVVATVSHALRGLHQNGTPDDAPPRAW